MSRGTREASVGPSSATLRRKEEGWATSDARLRMVALRWSQLCVQRRKSGHREHRTIDNAAVVALGRNKTVPCSQTDGTRDRCISRQTSSERRAHRFPHLRHVTKMPREQGRALLGTAGGEDLPSQHWWEAEAGGSR